MDTQAPREDVFDFLFFLTYNVIERLVRTLPERSIVKFLTFVVALMIGAIGVGLLSIFFSLSMALMIWFGSGALALLIGLALPVRRLAEPITKEKLSFRLVVLSLLMSGGTLVAAAYFFGKNFRLRRSDRRNPQKPQIDDALSLLRQLRKAPRTDAVIAQYEGIRQDITEMRSEPDKFREEQAIDHAASWREQMAKRKQIAAELAKPQDPQAVLDQIVRS
jgi:hypothetical protein